MKGPKPRPILKQGGVVIRGTPIEPISASNTVVSFSHDQEMAEESSGGAKRAGHESTKTKGSGKVKVAAPKHIAPVMKNAGKTTKSVLPEKPAPKAIHAKSTAAQKSKEVSGSSKKSSAKAVTSTRSVASKKPTAVKAERKAAPVKKPVKAAVKSVTKAKSQKTKPASAKKKSSR
jgi:hypothetical protein